ncbi:MAG TPA: SurA N-terminal domain-containing protein [bacterium]|nr:SurA N-terminal domain-containing protein [bacterium]
MFADIRKKSSSILVSLMFAAIIVTFVISFGPGDDAGCSEKKNYAASVNGEIITASEFRFSYSNLFDYYQRVYQDAFNNETAKQMKLAQKALDGLVGEVLMAQKAEELGFKVSDEEVRKEITTTPYFQNGGKFDRDTYNKMVQFTLNTTVSSYEHKVRLQLLSRKLRSFLFNSVGVSDTEMKEAFVLARESYDINVMALSEAVLKKEVKDKIAAEVSSEEIKKLLETDLAKVKLKFEDNVSKYSKEGGDGKTTFENSKEAVAKDMIVKTKIEEKTASDSKKLFEELKKDMNLAPEKIAKMLPDWNIEKKEALNITKNTRFVQGVGFSPKFVQKLFEKKEGMMDDVFVTDENNYVVAWVKEYKPADMTKFDAEKEMFGNSIRTSKISAVLQNYVDDLKSKANISVNAEFLKLYEDSGNNGE